MPNATVATTHSRNVNLFGYRVNQIDSGLLWGNPQFVMTAACTENHSEAGPL